MSSIQLRVSTFNECDSGSFDYDFKILSTMRIEALNRLNNAFASSSSLTVENPNLNSSLNIGIILKILHLTDRLETDSIQTTFNDDSRRCGNKLVIELI